MTAPNRRWMRPLIWSSVVAVTTTMLCVLVWYRFVADLDFGELPWLLFHLAVFWVLVLWTFRHVVLFVSIISVLVLAGWAIRAARAH